MILSKILGLENIPESDIIEPADFQPVKPGEVAIGAVGVLARKLFSILTREAEEIDQQVSKIRKGQEISVKTLEELEARRRRALLMKEVFWQEVKEEIEGAAEEKNSGIAIRQEWQIVKLPDEPEIRLIKFVLGCDDPNCTCHKDTH